MKVKGNFWIEKNNKSFLGRGRIELLKKLTNTVLFQKLQKR